jgi:hypothetical protein
MHRTETPTTSHAVLRADSGQHMLMVNLQNNNNSGLSRQDKRMKVQHHPILQPLIS